MDLGFTMFFGGLAGVAILAALWKPRLIGPHLGLIVVQLFIAWLLVEAAGLLTGAGGAFLMFLALALIVGANSPRILRSKS